MKKQIVVCLALLLAACATDPSEQKWAAIVTPYDQPPTECTKRIPNAPKPKLVAHDGKMAADEYRKLRNSYVDISNSYGVCQTWAKGQR